MNASKEKVNNHVQKNNKKTSLLKLIFNTKYREFANIQLI